MQHGLFLWVFLGVGCGLVLDWLFDAVVGFSLGFGWRIAGGWAVGVLFGLGWAKEGCFEVFDVLRLL